MKKFLVTMLAALFVIAGVGLTAEAQEEAKYSFKIVTTSGITTKVDTLSNLLETYAKERATIIAPYGVKDIVLGDDAVIGAGVKLVLPCTEDQESTRKDAINPDLTDGENPKLVSSLVIDNNAQLTVKGDLIISGHTGRGGEIHNAVTGDYGQVKLESGTTIVVEKGGTLQNYGYVTGSGKITVKDGAEATDLYQIARFIGGGQMLELFGVEGADMLEVLAYYQDNGIDENQYPFPFPEAGSGNISAQIKFQNGAKLVGTAKICVGDMENACEATLVGEDGLYVQNGGYITKKSTLSANPFKELNREVYQFSGKCSLNATTVSLNMMSNLFSMNVMSEKFVCSIGGKTLLRVASGGELSVDHAFRFMPGATLEVKEDGKLVLNDKPVNGTFGAEEMQAVITGKSSTGYLIFDETVRGSYASGSAPAKLVVNGTVDLGTSGYIFGLNEKTLEIGKTGKVLFSCEHPQTIKNWEIPDMYDETGNLKAGETVAVFANWDYLNEVGTSVPSLKAGGRSFTVKWSKATSGADGYQIYYATKSDFSNAEKVLVKDVNTTSKKIKGLTAGKKYYVKVRTYKTVGDARKYAEWSPVKTVITNPVSTTLASVTAGGRSFTAKWSKVTSGADGYQIYYATKSDFSNAKKVLVDGASTTSKKITGLAAGKKYYVKVRTYITVGDSRKYSAWSSVKTVIPNPVSTSLTSVKAGGRSFTANWEEVTRYADGYQIYYATKSNFSDAKKILVKDAGTTSKKITGLAAGKKYYVKVRTYITVGDSRKYSAWSSVETVIPNPVSTSLTSVTAGTRSFTAKWEEVTRYADGYQIYYATKSDFSNAEKILVKDEGTTSKKITGLTAGKKYYVKVRTYKTVGDSRKYSAWSTTKTVTTK